MLCVLGKPLVQLLVPSFETEGKMNALRKQRSGLEINQKGEVAVGEVRWEDAYLCAWET